MQAERQEYRGRMTMIVRKFRRISNIVLNGVLLFAVAGLLFITVSLVRTKLLENAQSLGMSLVMSYAVEEEMTLSSLETNLLIASQYVDEILAEGGSREDIQSWLLSYFNKLTDAIGADFVDVYAVVDGEIVAAKPWEGDDTYHYEETDWYLQATEAGGEIVCGDVSVDAVTGQSVFTLSKEMSRSGDVFAMNVYIQNPLLHNSSNSLPEDCSYYLCDQNGNLLYSVVKWDHPAEQIQSYADFLLAGIEDGSLIAYDASFQDMDGVSRGVYYYRMANGWTVMMTIPISSILMGEENTLIFVVAGVALLLFLALTLVTVQDFFRSRRMKMADDTAHMLGDSFYSIYRVNFRTGSYTAIKNHESIEDRVSATGDYAKLLETVSEVVRPDTFRAFENSFSLESIRSRIEQGIVEHGGDYQRRFREGYRWVNIRTLYNPEVSRDEVILCFRDVDEEKRRELQHTILLQDALDAARRSTKSKSEFFSRMSHDMRTPLNAVLGCSDLARRSLSEGDLAKTDQYLGQVSFAGRQLLALINDILELSRLEAGKNDLELRETDLRELFAGTAALFRVRAQEEGKQLEVELDLEDGAVMADEKKVIQIVNNLLSNAVKYTNRGDVIRFQAKQFSFERMSKYQIIVEDTGIGMTPEFLDHLFDPYSRETAFTSQSVSGTGLGMPIVKSLVQQMSGEISVESTLGKGTRFTVTLPFARADGEKKEPALPDAGTAAAFSWEGRRVLVAEDNDLNREIICAVLEEFGARVLSAENGAEALRLFSAEPPFSVDAVLMDMHMPEMDGCQAAAAIRGLERPDAKDVPILAVTANVFAEDIAATTKAGMNGHISKPIDGAVLRQTMEKLILEREAARGRGRNGNGGGGA